MRWSCNKEVNSKLVGKVGEVGAGEVGGRRAEKVRERPKLLDV